MYVAYQRGCSAVVQTKQIRHQQMSIGSVHTDTVHSRLRFQQRYAADSRWTGNQRSAAR